MINKNRLLLLSAILYAFQMQAKEVKSKIKEVTVYVQGAEIERTASSQLTPGFQTIEFTGLTTQLDPNSIRVNGKGEYTILSVQYTTDYTKPKSDNKRIDVLKDSLVYVQNKIDLKDAEVNNLQKEYNMVVSNAVTYSDADGSSASQLREMADFYRGRLSEISGMTVKARNELKSLRLDYARMEGQLRSLQGDRGIYQGKILVDIQSSKSQSASFQLKYLSNAARWSPLFDLRVPSVEQAEVILVQRAQVSQSTGVNWESVTMKLSTGFPYRNQTKPDLHPWVIDYQRIYQNGYSNSEYKMVQPVVLEDDVEEDAVFSNAKSVASVTKTIENQLNTVFEIPIKYTIPSNNEAKNVEVRELELPVEYKYFALPKLDDVGYFTAILRDWHKFNLMPGPTKLFVDGGYIGETYLNPNIAADSMVVSLGRDEQLSLKRNRLENIMSTTVIGANKKEVMAIEITVRNNKKKAVDLELVDQVPISRRKEIQVSIEEISEGNLDDRTGIIKWNVHLEPGETKKYIIKYEVKYPKDQVVNL